MAPLHSFCFYLKRSNFGSNLKSMWLSFAELEPLRRGYSFKFHEDGRSRAVWPRPGFCRAALLSTGRISTGEVAACCRDLYWISFIRFPSQVIYPVQQTKRCILSQCRKRCEHSFHLVYNQVMNLNPAVPQCILSDWPHVIWNINSPGWCQRTLLHFYEKQSGRLFIIE